MQREFLKRLIKPSNLIKGKNADFSPTVYEVRGDYIYSKGAELLLKDIVKKWFIEETK